MLDRTSAPPFVKSSSFNLIKPGETILRNGIPVFFVSGGSQDVVKIELIFEAGRWFETKRTAAHFTANMLSKGTRTKSSFDIARIFDQYGAHLEINPGLDFVSVALYALSKNLMPVLDLLVDIVSAPVFPDNEFRQAQSIYIQNLKISNEKTSYVASQVFRKTLFGDDHPYGAEVAEAHVLGLAPDDLNRHFTDLFRFPHIMVSGKITDATRDAITGTLGDLPVGTRPSAASHSVKATAQDQRLEKKESVQASVRMGKRSVMRAHPEYVPVLFVAHILGGYFGSRLMKNIREEKGLTYGISASVHGLRNDTYMVIGADVNKENVELTFSEIAGELKRLRTEEISEDELETSRNHFIGSLQAEITTPFAHAEKIKTIKLFDLKPDHYQKMITRIESMSAADIMAIGHEYFHEESFVRVAVG